MTWMDEVLRDPQVRKAYEKAQRREARRDRLYRVRHRLFPFMHVWHGPFGDDLMGTRCGVCGKTGPRMKPRDTRDA